MNRLRIVLLVLLSLTLVTLACSLDLSQLGSSGEQPVAQPDEASSNEAQPLLAEPELFDDKVQPSDEKLNLEEIPEVPIEAVEGHPELGPPANAEAQAREREDIPMLPDAQVEFLSADVISYRTTNNVEQAAQFYEDEMPKDGWTAKEDNTILSDAAILGYTKDGETATVFIGTDKNGTNVLIIIDQG